MPNSTPSRVSAATRSRLAAIVEAAEDGIIALDLAGVVTDWNQGAEAILGYTAEEMIGQAMTQVIPAERINEEVDALAAISRGERVRSFETVRMKKDGQPVEVSVSVSPIREVSGRIIGASKIMRDITAQKERERELDRLARLYAALNHVSQSIVLSKTRSELFDRICRALVDHGGFHMAWIGWRDQSRKRILPVAAFSHEPNPLSEMRDYYESHPDGVLQANDVFYQGRPFICNDLLGLPLSTPWRKPLIERGFRSAAGFPIQVKGVVQGVLTVYSEEAGFFRDREVELLKESANDVSFAVTSLAESEERLLAMKAVEEERRFSSMLIESLPGVFYFYDDQFRFLRWNKNHEEVSGYSSEETARMNPLELIPESQRALVAERIGEVFKEGESSVESSFLSKDGTETPYFFTGKKVMYNGVQCLVGIGLDISERKRARELLRETERRYRTLFEYAPDGILISDSQSNYVDANSSICRMLGYTRDELLTMRSSQVVAPFEVARIKPALGLIRSGANYHDEWVILRKDGSAFPADIIATVMPDGNILAMFRDITERKSREDELRWKTAFLEAQVDSSMDGILVVNAEGRKILQNARMNELWKIPPEIAESDDDDRQRQFVTGRTKNPTEFREKIAHLYSNPNEVSRDEVELVDGTMLDRYSAPVIDPSGTYYGRIWTFRDVTTERNREAKLTQALEQEKVLTEKARAGERAKGEFLAVMSHEIRTPLNGILGFSEILAHTPDLPTESRNQACTILASGEALLRILDDVLDFSRIEAGRMSIERTTFSPQELLESTRELLLPLAAEKHLSLETSLDPMTPRFIVGDAARTRQILLNLAGNAVKFTERGGVTLGVRRDEMGSLIEFFVADTGPGIAPAQLENIFQAFTQADSSHARRHGGSGLGLTICRRLAKLMGGTLVARSTVGQGAVFTLSLPLEEAADAPTPLAAIAPVKLTANFAQEHPLRVLVVEDDKVNLRVICKFLRRLGYEPLAATNGKQAVEVYREVHPECTFMDVQMPEMDGIAATRAIRAAEASNGGDRPGFIAALTANILPADRTRCFEAGVNAYLNKPMSLATLASALIEAHSFASVAPRNAV